MPEEPNQQPTNPNELPDVQQPTVVSSDSSPVSPAVSPITPIQAPSSQPAGQKTKKLLGIPLIALAAVLLLVGGSAAAYFAVVVPNRPENVLKKAITNVTQARQAKFEGKLAFESTDPDADIKAVNVAFNGESDADKNAFQSAFEVTASGVKVPFEMRYIEKSLFFKIGDLGSVKGLVQASAPEAAPFVDALGQKLSDQWIELDETLLKQAGGSCALDTSFALTQADIDLLQKRYQEVPFTTTKNTSSDTVNGRSAYKYEMELDDNKGAEYLKGLEELSVIKKIRECSGDKDPIDTAELADDDHTPFTIWVDKSSKQIVKFASQSTQQDEDKAQFKASIEMTFTYDGVNIAKPEGAKPIMEVLGDFGQLFGGLDIDGLGSATPLSVGNLQELSL